ncbi:YuiB family protein [Paenibacillus marinisediminis]
MEGLIMAFILMLLFFVMMFGIGFILNMLMKTTWFPVGLFVVVFIPLTVYMMWDSAESLAENLLGYGLFDYLTGLAGLIGALVSGMTINTLRKRGFKMF